MKFAKRILLLLSALLLLLFGTAFVVPLLFKDQLVDKAREVINQNINAEVDFQDVRITLFRHFPDVTLGLDALTVKGIDRFEGVKLADIDRLDLTLDLMSVISSSRPVELENIDVDNPWVHILVLEDGAANYDIAKATTTADSSGTEDSAASDFLVQLNSYSLRNATFIYDDASLNTLVNANGIQHTGNGAFTAMVYDLVTKTSIDSITVDYGGVRYLQHANATLDAIFNIDQNDNTYTLKDNELVVNALALVGNGFVQLQQDDIIMDLKIDAPSNDVKDLLSLVPGAYLQGYEQVKASGDFSFDGIVKGIYNAGKEQLPRFDFNMNVNGAQVQYPDLPLGISSIFAKARVNSPSSDLDELQIDMPRFQLKIGSNPIDGRFSLRRPLSNPTVDMALDGRLDLDELKQAFPVEGVETMNGIITADMQAKASMKQLDEGDYQNVDMSGAMSAQNVNYRGQGQPQVQVTTARMEFSPRYVNLPELKAQLGKSDIDASGRIDNILAYFTPDQTMRGQLTLRSDLFDANEWLPDSGPTTAADEPSSGQLYSATGDTTTQQAVFDRFDFGVDAEVNEIRYADYVIRNSAAKGQLSPNRFKTGRLATQIEDSDIAASGVIVNVMDYLLHGETLTGTINVKSGRLNLNPFMTTMETPEQEDTAAKQPTSGEGAYGVILIPDNIRLAITSAVDELVYTNMTLRNLRGRLEVEDRTVALRDVTGNTLGGQVALNGMYDTRNAEEPGYSMSFGMDRMNIKQTFNTLNTFQQLAPIGAFLEGIFTTSLAMEGTLGPDMMPKLSTLDAKGFFQTVDAVIEAFPPLQKVGNTLNIKELRESLRIGNTKNWLEIRDGAVEVKPFDVTLAGIDMQISGRHGIDQLMDYRINAAIPREKLENNPAGAAAAQGRQQMFQQAAGLGVKSEQGEFVNVGINLGNTLRNPNVKVEFLGMDGETSLKGSVADNLKSQAEQQKEALKEEAKGKVDTLKQEATEKATAVVDSAKAAASKKAEELAEEAKKKAGEKAGELVKGAVDSSTAKGAEKLKEELEKFNPFKKKKSGSSGNKKEGESSEGNKKKGGG